LPAPRGPLSEESGTEPSLASKPLGPFPARIESLETDLAFRGLTTAADPDAALALYVTELPLDRRGEWRLVALVRDGDRLLASRLPSIKVAEHAEIPAVGETAPRVHTPTVAFAGITATGINYTGPSGAYSLTSVQRNLAIALKDALDKYKNGGGC
jgi:hypothetical protein